jgi:hypothetical protein
VSELELQLVALGQELELPAAPDLAPGVLGKLEGRRPFPWRRATVLAFALAAIAVGVAFAVPQARTAILRFFHLGGATVVRVETLPPAVERKQVGGLGAPYSPAEAEQRLGFRLMLPPFRGGPSRVYVLGDSVGTVIVRWKGKRVLLSEFSPFGAEGLKKLADGATVVEPVTVSGRQGLWIQGAPHTLTYIDRSLGIRERTILVRGNVLLWIRGRLTLRLEGKLNRSEAIELARHIR